jgi:hypothetical protein
MRTLWMMAALVLGSCTRGHGVLDDRACAARGGLMRRVCENGFVTCVERYADAGKPCTDREQCLGRCLYEVTDSPPPTESVVGVCEHDTNPCGCFNLVVHGKVEPGGCLD